MKIIYIDVDGVIISKENEVRPYFDVVLEYCFDSSVRVFIGAKDGPEYARKVVEANYPQFAERVSGFFSTAEELDRTPSLLISCNNELLKKHNGIMVPFYRSNVHKKYACVVLAGKLLEAIRDKVVLNKEKQEAKPPVKKTAGPNVRPEVSEKPEDTSQWGVSI